MLVITINVKVVSFPLRSRLKENKLNVVHGQKKHT